MAYYNSVEEFCKDWGYNPNLAKIQQIMAYFEVLMERPIRIYRGWLIVDDDLFERAEKERKAMKLQRVDMWGRRKDAQYWYGEIMTLSRFDEWKAAYEKYWEVSVEEGKTADGGVYGIYEDGELVYIGSTNRSFEARFQEHLDNLNNGDTSLYLYREIDKDKEIQFAPLVVKKDLKVEGELTFRDIQVMELALIDQCQPKYNLAGRVVDFKFWKEESEN